MYFELLLVFGLLLSATLPSPINNISISNDGNNPPKELSRENVSDAVSESSPTPDFLNDKENDLAKQETFYPVGVWWGVRPWGGGWSGWGGHRPWYGWHGPHGPHWGGSWGGHWGGHWDGGRWGRMSS